MNKFDLARRIRAQNPNLRLRKVEKIVDAMFNEMTTTMARGERIDLRGFGTFSIGVGQARIGRNPKTGAPVPITKKTVHHFKAGQESRS